MLNNIHIQNFRCFEDFKAEGFERINLIGGKNNSGKTCLLEGIACLSSKFSIQDIVFHRENSNLLKILVNKNHSTNDFEIESNFTHKNHNFISSTKIAIGDNNALNSNSRLNNIEIDLITQKIELPALSIVTSFDEFDAKLLKNRLIKILKIIDGRIEDIRTFNTKNGLYIKLSNSVYEPLSNFGDATKNLIRYFTPIFEKELTPNKGDKFSILLIDEIENGIHFSAHKDFWKNIFTLSKELNVQVFATTHSLEMIKAFNEVAKEEGGGAYFEMFRNEEENKIKCIKHDADLLEYELETNHSFRGE